MPPSGGWNLQASTIKAAALKAFKKAFDKYPVDASEGTANTGDNRSNVVNGYNFDRYELARIKQPVFRFTRQQRVLLEEHGGGSFSGGRLTGILHIRYQLMLLGS
jgi:hypothetical protein